MRVQRLWFVFVLSALVLAGSRSARADEKAEKAEAKIKANLAKLSSADRKVAEAQKYCAVEIDDRLGSMGVPFKVVLKGQTVFLCCKGCKKDAEAAPDKTLASAKKLKEKAAKERQK